MTIPSLRFRAETLISPDPCGLLALSNRRTSPNFGLLAIRLPQAVPRIRPSPGQGIAQLARTVDFAQALWLSCNKPCLYDVPKEPIDVTLSPSETEGAFAPRFDAAGLLTAVAVDAASGEVLMLAHMDVEALAKTRETGLAHFHSRSRGRLWMKGESSGHTLRVVEIRVDCDQDAIVLRVKPTGPACHTGATSCFYRVLEGDRLALVPS